MILPSHCYAGPNILVVGALQALTNVDTSQAPSQEVVVVGKEQSKLVNGVVQEAGNVGLDDKAEEGVGGEYWRRGW